MKITMRHCAGACTRSIAIDDPRFSGEAISKAVISWISEWEWPPEGLMVWVSWILRGDSGEYIDCGEQLIEIEPDHETMIDRALREEDGRPRGTASWRCCGSSPDDHEWVRRDAIGMSRLVSREFCPRCGLGRILMEHKYNESGRMAPMVTYEMPDRWCPECRSETCSCPE